VNRPRYCGILTCLLGASLCTAPAHSRAVGQQRQIPATPLQDTAKQRSDDEEKNLIAAVTAAESGDADPKTLVKALEALAMFYQRRNRKVELSPVLERELAVAEKVWPNDDPGIARTLEQIAMGFGLCNERDRAVQIRLRILNLYTKLYGLTSPQVASEFLSLGRTSMFKPDSPDAENYFMQALAINQLLHDDHASAVNVSALAALARIQKNPEKADALLAHEIAVLQLNAGRNAADISNMLEARANIASTRGDFTSAIDYTKEAMAIEESSRVLPDSIKRDKLTDIGDLYRQRGDLGPAEESIQQALQLAEADDKDTKHMSEVGPLMALALLYMQEKKFKEAEAALTRVMDLENKGRGADSPGLAQPCALIAEIYAAQEMNAQAEVQFRRAIALSEADQGVTGHELPQFLAEYAYFLKKLNRNEEADKLLQRARDIIEKRKAAVQNQTPQI
jgi:tetratricopeptide (TPR) repeat protein